MKKRRGMFPKSLGLALMLASACSGAPHKQVEKPNGLGALKTPEATPILEAQQAAPKEAPPPSAPARPVSVVKSSWAELGNGLSVASRQDRTLPIVHLRFVIGSGSAVDEEQTGLAEVCGHAIAYAGAGAMDALGLQKALEAMGATLSVDVGPDRVVYGITVARPFLDEVLALGSAIVSKPRLYEKDFLQLQNALADASEKKAKTKGQFGAMMVLYRDLFTLPSDHHPYASYAALSDEIRKIKPSDCKVFHRRYFVPQNALVAAAGDIAPLDFRKAVEGAFGKWRGDSAPTPSFTDPMPPESSKITLIDYPGQQRAEIVVGTLAPKREEPGFAPFLLATEIIGGAKRGRLFQALHEKKDLADPIVSNLLPFQNGPSIFYSYAQTSTRTVAETLQAMLDARTRLAEEAPTDEEITNAASFLEARQAVKDSLPGQNADDLDELWLQKAPDDAPLSLARALRNTTPVTMTKYVSEFVREGHTVIVVSGDASALGPKLQAFGEVKVVDPTARFSRTRTLPAENTP